MVQAAAPLDIARRPDAAQLARVVIQLRWRVGLERLLVWIVRGIGASATLFIGVSIVVWLTQVEVERGLFAWCALPILATIVVAAWRWPSATRAARLGDRRLALDERIATALELARQPRGGRFDALQLRDTLEAVSASRRLPWRDLKRTELLATLMLVLLAVASLALPSMPRPTLPTTNDQQLSMLEIAAEDADARAAAIDVQDLPPASDDVAAIQQSQTDADLAQRVQLEQAERDALDRLSQALGKVSAAQPAADAINNGDFSSAKDLLSNLGEEADQLSDAAKQQLSRALQQAASPTTNADRQLADRERQAATALQRGNYNEQRQSLKNLGDQVEKSAAKTATEDQLARDVGRLQQQTSTSQQGQGTPTQANAGAATAGQPATAGQASAADGGANGQGTLGQQGGPGVGAGPGGDMTGDQANRLESAGQSVQVPTKLGAGPGVRPTDGTEDQTGNDPTAGNRAVSELVQTQQTGEVAPEQNLVPGEQRPVVRGYFH